MKTKRVFNIDKKEEIMKNESLTSKDVTVINLDDLKVSTPFSLEKLLADLHISTSLSSRMFADAILTDVNSEGKPIRPDKATHYYLMAILSTIQDHPKIFKDKGQAIWDLLSQPEKELDRFYSQFPLEEVNGIYWRLYKMHKRSDDSVRKDLLERLAILEKNYFKRFFNTSEGLRDVVFINEDVKPENETLLKGLLIIKKTYKTEVN